MIKIIPLNFVVVIFFVFVTSADASVEWYKNTKYSCSDPYNTKSLFSNTLWFNNHLPLKFESVSEGFVYADISADTVKNMSDLRNKYYGFETIKLDSAKANHLRSALEKSTSDASVPLFIQNLPSLIGYFASNTSSVVISSIFSYLFDQVGTIKLQRASLVPLIASGGLLEHQIRLVYKNSKYFFSSRYLYSVSVGSEVRRVWLSGCTYPANIKITGFKTTIGVNDKRIFLEGDKWFVENIIDGERDDGFLRKAKEDESFVYFKAENGFSSFYMDYRIGKFGGPFQANDEGKWVTFYATTSPLSN
jgi:hypothetical protein